MQYNFTIAHIPGNMNTAADFFLPCLEMNPNEKVILKVREDIPTNPTEVNIEATGIAQEEPVFFDTTDQHQTTEKELWKPKEEARNGVPNDPPVITVSCYYANDLHKDTNNCEHNTYNETIAFAYRTRFWPKVTEFQTQNVGSSNWRTNFHKWCALYAFFKKQKKRINIKDDIFCRQYIGDLGEISLLQVLLLEHLLKVFLKSLHGTAGKHPGILKRMEEVRQK